MDDLIQDLRFGTRMLLKSPLVTGAAILSLALGIGANTAIFTVVHAVFLQAMPLERADRLARVYTLEWEFPGQFTGVSFANYEDYRDEATSFAGLAAVRPLPVNLVPDQGDPREISAELVTGNYFDVLGIAPHLGRFFLPEEDRRPTPVAVLSHGIWVRQFGSDPAVVGSAIRLGELEFDVVGVAPPGFKGLDVLGEPDLVWLPMEVRHRVLTGTLAQYFDLRRARFAQVIGRLAEGVTVEQARAEIFAIGTRLQEEYPTDNAGRSGDVQPYSPINLNQRDEYARAGGLLMAVVGVVLLIACANVANLLLARAADREKEIGIRVAMGAGRDRLLRQLLTESLVLAVVGGLAGIALASGGARVLGRFRPPFLSANAVSLDLDPTVLGFTLVVALATGILFGVVPALQAANPDLRSTLQEGGRRSSSGGNRALLRSGLIVAEVALAVVALVGAGLFVRSMANARAVDPGFEDERLVLIRLNIGNAGYDEDEGRQFWRDLQERLTELPGVESVSLQSGQLLGGGIPHTTYPEGVDIADGLGRHVNDIVVSPSYFETVGIGLRSGRLLGDLDRAETARVAVINEATRELFWPDSDPLGRRFTRSAEDGGFYEVVGVVDDALIDLAEPAQPIIYTALDQFPQAAAQVQVRTAGDPMLTIADVQRTIRDLDPSLPLLELATVSQDMHRALWAPRMATALLSVFGALALALAVVGIYGVMSYSVRQRHHEIGLRLALGAGESRVMRLVVRQGMTRVTIGLGLGILLALASTRLIRTMLWGIGAADPVTFVSVSALLLVVALVATLVPALRVTRVDPLIAMRDE